MATQKRTIQPDLIPEQPADFSASIFPLLWFYSQNKFEVGSL